MRKMKCGIAFVLIAIILVACNPFTANSRTHGTDDTQPALDDAQTEMGQQNDIQYDKVQIFVATEDSLVYSDEELQEMAQFYGTISELTEQHPAARVHRWNNYYVVLYFGNEKAVYIRFDMNGNNPYGQVFSIAHRSDAFEKLKVGDTLEKVYEMDPDGRYPFLQTGNGLPDKFSQHLTKDKYFITISYEEDETGILRITHFNWERY